jgi:hypothetical protein
MIKIHGKLYSSWLIGIDNGRLFLDPVWPFRGWRFRLAVRGRISSLLKRF